MLYKWHSLSLCSRIREQIKKSGTVRYKQHGRTVNIPILSEGAIQLLLYNMSSMLASVAAGYDVRLSNISPIHPRLHPPPANNNSSRSGGGSSASPPSRLYPHNTYHGHTPHYRTPLTDIKPLRFTDSPQHALSARYLACQKIITAWQNLGFEVLCKWKWELSNFFYKCWGDEIRARVSNFVTPSTFW
jgi:hypothetical protein